MENTQAQNKCILCPRECNADRVASLGYCGEGKAARVAKAMLHPWEEPCLCSRAPSGAVFFSGCSLKCVYCQNSAISRTPKGELYSPQALGELFLSLQSQGAQNINLVTPTHFADIIRDALDAVRPSLSLPVVWNTSGYEKSEAVRALNGYADIFLTDFKYASHELSARYSFAPDYPEIAAKALSQMVALTGEPQFEGEELKKGVILRHLVLPGCYRDSIAVLRRVAELVGTESVILSLMAQYTPEFLKEGYTELARRITTYEYEKVADEARALGFNGYFQERSAASCSFTPDF